METPNALRRAYPLTSSNNTVPDSPGLTKCELFAAMSMEGYRANPSCVGLSRTSIMKKARDDADALLAELEKGKE